MKEKKHLLSNPLVATEHPVQVAMREPGVAPTRVYHILRLMKSTL